MRSIQLATLGRALRTLCCPSPVRVRLTGVTPASLFWVHSLTSARPQNKLWPTTNFTRLCGMRFPVFGRACDRWLYSANCKGSRALKLLNGSVYLFLRSRRAYSMRGVTCDSASTENTNSAVQWVFDLNSSYEH